MLIPFVGLVGTTHDGGGPGNAQAARPVCGTAPIPSWEDCAAAGLSVVQAARARGRHHSSATSYARQHGLVFAGLRVLAALTAAERADYDRVKKALRCTRADALRAVGRPDLMSGGGA